MAPHTLPSDSYIAIDRRILPGDDPTEATDEIRKLLTSVDGFEISVTEGYSMLPNWVEDSEPELVNLRDAHTAVAGVPPDLTISAGTFDAGGPGSRGIPSVQYGASGGIWPTGVDFVSIQDVVTETRTLLTYILT
jgi:acetylornithine deacetylase/succinyl-diaminopimelate desuccinylase-like protein